jgi:signal transduction histidine kinase/CheY-like chemotaxis protein
LIYTEGFSKELIVEAFSNNQSGHTGYSLNGLSRYGYYAPVGINNWVLLTVITQGSVRDNSRTFIASSISLSLLIALILLAVSSILIVYNRQMREKADAANRAKSSFLANMSHEIRTPMNVVIGTTELLLNEKLNYKQMRYVYDIKASSAALLDIINDILDISKIEANKLDLSPVDYSFSELIANIQSMFQFIARKKNIEFKLVTEGEIPPYLYGDEIRLNQVLVNICGNAVKFTNEGHVCLKVKSANETIVFRIEDTGIGISADTLKTIFNPFTQVDTEKNRSIQGTGLGLSISKQLVEMMGGSIAADSVYGQGSVFTITIPKITGNGDLVRQREVKPQIFHAPSCNILVVDDNESNLKVARGFLAMFDISADTATSGAKAIKLVTEKNYDIVFMDHMMPKMDGVETTKRIREISAAGVAYKDLRIIALTANTVSGAKEMFLANGFDDFLSKPIEMEKLTEILMEWLPKEKIEKLFIPADNSKPQEENSDFLEQLNNISVINVKRGMYYFMNTQEMYRETLMLFYTKIVPECEKMKMQLAEGNFTDFKIYIHGIKSSLLTVGIMELSAFAYELETAAASDDKQFCLSHYPEFFKQMMNLYDQLTEVFSEKENSPSESHTLIHPNGNIDLLTQNIQIAIKAANDCDNDLGIEALSELQKYNFGETAKEQIKKAIDSFRYFDFDQALSDLTGLQEFPLPGNTDTRSQKIV